MHEHGFHRGVSWTTGIERLVTSEVVYIVVFVGILFSYLAYFISYPLWKRLTFNGFKGLFVLTLLGGVCGICTSGALFWKMAVPDSGARLSGLVPGMLCGALSWLLRDKNDLPVNSAQKKAPIH